jgi:hypothetical protein
MFDTSFLYASLLWGTIGAGFCLYGKKQAATVPLAGGLVMIALSYFVASALLMSLLGAALIGVMIFLMRLGY